MPFSYIYQVRKGFVKGLETPRSIFLLVLLTLTCHRCQLYTYDLCSIPCQKTDGSKSNPGPTTHIRQICRGTMPQGMPIDRGLTQSSCPSIVARAPAPAAWNAPFTPEQRHLQIQSARILGQRSKESYTIYEYIHRLLLIYLSC